MIVLKRGQSVIIAIVNNGIMNFISLSSGQFDSLQNVKTRLNEIYPKKFIQLYTMNE